MTNDVGAMVVLDGGGRIEGILTATGFVRGFGEGMTTPGGTVAEYVRTDVATTTRDALVNEVTATMNERPIHHVRIVDGDEVVETVTTLDLAARIARSR